MSSPAFSAEQLRPAIIDFYLLAKGVPPQFNDDGRLHNYRTDLINRWRRTLIRDIEFCIACELRHILDGRSKPRDGSGWAAWFEKHFGDVGSLWYQKYKRISPHGRKYPPVTDNSDFNEDVGFVFAAHDSSSPRTRSYIAAKCAEAQHGLSLIEVCHKVYDPSLVSWSGGFGGGAWQEVAKTLFALWVTTDPNEIMRLIDTAFALQHNTAIVFNKNLIWAGPDSYHWLMQTLDAKWVAVSPEALLGYASKPLKEAAQALHFSRQFEVPPDKLTIEPKGGTMVLLRDGMSNVEAVVTEVTGGYFRSVTAQSSSWQIHKSMGKYSKVVNFKIFSLPEFLFNVEKVLDVKATWKDSEKIGKAALSKKLAKLIEKAANVGNPFKVTPPLTATPIMQQSLSTAYDHFNAYVQSKGYSLGQFLTQQLDGNTLLVRFRLKGNADTFTPLRFFFKIVLPTPTSGFSILYVTNMESADYNTLGEAKKVFVNFKSGEVVNELKAIFHTHIGG